MIVVIYLYIIALAAILSVSPYARVRFRLVARAPAIDSPGTSLNDSNRVGFVPSQKLRHAIDGK